MVFPSALKDAAAGEPTMRFVVRKSLFSKSLEMYTYAQWERDSEAVRGRLNFFNPEHDAFWREYMRDTAVVEPDDKVGRILIPRTLLEKASISAGSEIVFSGANHMITIWPKEEYEAQSLRSDEFVALAGKILG